MAQGQCACRCNFPDAEIDWHCPLRRLFNTNPQGMAKVYQRRA
jgi:predicted metal-dependent peptidase